MSEWQGIDEETNACFGGTGDTAEWSSIESALRRAVAHGMRLAADDMLGEPDGMALARETQERARAIERGEDEGEFER